MTPYDLSETFLESLLQDDAPNGDITTWSLGIGERDGTLVFQARDKQVACCTEDAAKMGRLRDLSVVGPVVPSGRPVEPGQILLTLSGKAINLHRVWKPAQTLMECSAGIASATREIVDAARRANPNITVNCTRKQFSGTKGVSIKAIFAGGAVPHRLGLSETLLVFAEHRAFLDPMVPDDIVAQLHRDWPEKKVVVEVSGEAEAAQWIEAGADVIQLEKCSPDVVSSVIRFAGNRPVRIAAAGGVNATNAEAYARSGAHILVTSAPYTAKPRDVQVILRPS